MVLLPCSTCCGCPCPDGETLPSVVTATFSGLTKSAVKVSDLLSLSFKSCFGADAAGTVEATGGMPNEGGPITAISLTSGGSGYAVRGRTAPTALSITGSGSDATFTVTVAATSPDDCGRPLWKISSVKVTKGGTGYADNEQMSVSLGQDEFQSEPASISIRTKPSEPTLTATIATGTSGTDAEFSVTTKIVSTEPDRWGADKVTVLQPGSGYYEGETVWFDPQPEETTETRGYGLVELKRIQPAVAVNYSGGGFGAVLTPNLSQITDFQGRKAWECSSVSINAAGSGYVTGQFIYVYGDGLGQFADPPSIWSITAGAGGAIVSLTRIEAGRLYANADEIEAVKIENAGSYYGVSDVVETVTVNDGGKYYKEDSSLAPIVADVTVEVTQLQPSNGEGAKITAKVNEVVGGPGFGTISSIKLDDGGDDYLKWSYNIFDCEHLAQYNNKSIEIPRWNGDTRIDGLVAVEFNSCFGSGAKASIELESPGGGPYGSEGFPVKSVSLTDGGAGYAVRGRTQPTGLSIAAPPFANGVAAQCEITLAAQKLDNCGRPYWPISTIKVVDGGKAYQDAAPLTVSLGQNEFQHLAASLTSKTAVSEPQLSASPLYPETSGTGAQLTVSVKKVSDRRWGVDYVTVGSPGTGYNEGDRIRFDPLDGAIGHGFAGDGVVEVVRVEPTVTVEYFGSGSGAQFVPTLTKSTSNGRDVWICTQLAIASAGSGYFSGQNVYVRDGRAFSEPSIWEIFAGEGGAVVAVTSISPGQLWEDTDGIAAVVVTNHGFYYATDGALQEVILSSGGGYYKESDKLPPIVADVTVSVTQSPPSNGAGAKISAKVNDDVSDPEFGSIDSITLTDAGDGYLEWAFPETCQYQRCVGLSTVNVSYKGATTPPTVSIYSPPPPFFDANPRCQIEFHASEAQSPFVCQKMSFTATDVLGGSVSVVAGNPSSVPGCDDIINAKSFNVRLSGTSRTVYRYLPTPDPPLQSGCYAEGGWWGSKFDYAAITGEYSLQFTKQQDWPLGDTPRVIKTYEYTGTTSCGFLKRVAIDLVIINGGLSSMSLEAQGLEVFNGVNYTSTNPIELSCSGGMPCSAATGLSNQWNWSYSNGIFVTASCECDLESFKRTLLPPGGFFTFAETKGLSPYGQYVPCSDEDPCEYVLDSEEGVQTVTVESVTVGD